MICENYGVLIDVPKIVKLNHSQGTILELEIAKKLYDTYYNTYPDREGYWRFYTALSCVFVGGLIQGIRQERLKRKGKK